MRGDKRRKNAEGAGILATALLAAFLTGCEGTPRPDTFAAQTAQPETKPTAAQEPEAPTAMAPQPEAETATPEIAALPPEPVIDDNPARVLGLGPDRLTELLGRPELMRREPPAEIWQYRGESCVFDVFLYEEAGSFRVTYLEARDDSAERIAERNCLNQLLRARLTEPLS